MSTYRRYQEARDAAWRTLLHFQVDALPVDVEAITGKMGLAVLPFPAAQEAARLAGLIARAGSGPCVSLRIQGVWQIFLRPGCLDERERRFALAHELGHLVLRHETYALAPGVRAFRGRENAGDLLEAPEELDDYAADIFALRLLAPACVLHALGTDTPGGVAALCGLPPRAAAMRAERLELLARRDAFFTHPLEKQVWAQFQPFLQAMRLSDRREREMPQPIPAAAPLRQAPAPAKRRRGVRFSELLAWCWEKLRQLLRRLPFRRGRV